MVFWSLRDGLMLSGGLVVPVLFTLKADTIDVFALAVDLDIGSWNVPDVAKASDQVWWVW